MGHGKARRKYWPTRPPSIAPLTPPEGGAGALWLLCQHQARAWSLSSCYSVQFGECFLSNPRAPSCFPHHHHAAARRCSRREDGRGVGAPCHCPLLSAPPLPSLWLLPAASLQLLQEHVSSRSHFPSSLSRNHSAGGIKDPRNCIGIGCLSLGLFTWLASSRAGGGPRTVYARREAAVIQFGIQES